MSSELNYLLELGVPEKLELIGALWQSIDANGQSVPMSDSLVGELDRRKAEAQKDPSTLVSWEEVKRRLGMR
jgi:putative addiction module component (TIGR02574 family)